ncbi:carnitine O-acetyltransferase-like [Lates calcarifer]|uniref:Carnitine O-acetyltransferase-like n=1 Tax=Lates calcarifer TaxID=8187 RepID=A0AAJ8B2Y9_LATCA|nr:carnitine O-acetyltransferase-like [Lates calcarifer]
MLRILRRAQLKTWIMKPASAALVAGKNLTQQSGLPSQPVPPLKQTCELYLSIVEPIVGAEELKHTKKLVGEFLKAGGVGEKLQRSLERKACNTENWFTDIYVKNIYLNDRKPVVIYANVASIIPQTYLDGDKQGQIRRAAEVIVALLDAKMLIDNETLPAEYMGGKPLCMKQYEQVLSSCRIPGLKTDTLVFHSKGPNPPKHISVIHNCQFFMLDVYNSDGTLLTADQLCVQLEKICNASLQTNMEPVGILTTQYRDIWSKTYAGLIKDKTNKESLSAIERSIFTVCLDKVMPPVSDEMNHTSTILQMLHGGGSQYNSGNRWFDKGMQIIIGEDGTYGTNISHAGADGTTLNRLVEHTIEYMRKPQTMQSAMEPLPMPQKLHFNITPDIKMDIEEAKQHIDKLTQDLDLSASVFEYFGKNVIKAFKMSPDAFVQVALQLTYYRMYQQCCGVIEPASLRMFRHGRIDTIHSSSSASVAFVKAFDDPKKQNSEKLDLLDKAIKAHIWYINMAISGQAVQGHFMGLQNQAVEEKIPMPEIFTDTSFTKVFNFQISTSQVRTKFETAKKL